MEGDNSLRDKRTIVDRRSGEDRRVAYGLKHFPKGGLEGRKGKDRRLQDERCNSCVGVSKWSSVCKDDIS